MSVARASIVVIGGGLAGLSATAEALRQTRGKKDFRVALLDKSKTTGGNSAKASSGINGVGTSTQKAQNVKDSISLFVEDTKRSAHNISSDTLITKLGKDSADAVGWLQNEFDLSLDVLAQLGGHSAKRTHRFPDKNNKPQPVGWTIVSTVAKLLPGKNQEDKDRLDVINFARVTKILSEGSGKDAHVVGVEYELTDPGTKAKTHHTIKADAVILATGGFAGEGSNPNHLKKYRPDLIGIPSTNGPFATGDGLDLASAIGAGLIHMDRVQLHPTGFVKGDDPTNPTKFLAAEALRGEGGILLNAKGERFVDELNTRDFVSDKIQSLCADPSTRPHYVVPKPGEKVTPKVASVNAPLDEGEPKSAAFLVLSQAAADKFGHGSLGFYQFMKLIHESKGGLDNLAKDLQVDKTNLRNTLKEYDEAKKSGKPDKFGKKVFPQFALNDNDDQSYYWGIITPSIHYTMGGIKFDKESHVLRDDNSPIKDLFAAGEVTGGLHGYNRLGGNSLLECVVYGRTAGRNAVLEVLSNTKKQ